MKILVVYYSNGGNNKFLAEKLAREFETESEGLGVTPNALPLQIFFSLLKIGLKIKPLHHTPSKYDQIILLGPIWMGMLIAPLRSFIKKYRKDIHKLRFITCCGGGEKEKDSKFGYEKVFRQVRQLLGDTCVSCTAIPITLALPEDKRDNSDEVMNIKLSDETFDGDLKTRFDTVVSEIRNDSTDR